MLAFTWDTMTPDASQIHETPADAPAIDVPRVCRLLENLMTWCEARVHEEGPSSRYHGLRLCLLQAVAHLRSLDRLEAPTRMAEARLWLALTHGLLVDFERDTGLFADD